MPFRLNRLNISAVQVKVEFGYYCFNDSGDMSLLRNVDSSCSISGIQFIGYANSQQTGRPNNLKVFGIK